MYLWQIGESCSTMSTSRCLLPPESIATMEFLFQLKEAVKPPGYQVVVPSGGRIGLDKGSGRDQPGRRMDLLAGDQYAPDLLDVVKAIVPVPGEKNQVTNTFTNWLGIHSQSRNKELAWEFIVNVKPTVPSSSSPLMR